MHLHWCSLTTYKHWLVHREYLHCRIFFCTFYLCSNHCNDCIPLHHLLLCACSHINKCFCTFPHTSDHNCLYSHKPILVFSDHVPHVCWILQHRYYIVHFFNYPTIFPFILIPIYTLPCTPLHTSQIIVHLKSMMYSTKLFLVGPGCVWYGHVCLVRPGCV